MHIHILGICGTFMGGVAALARQAGHEVTGSDANVYPPMSTQLEQQGIALMQGYDASHLQVTAGQTEIDQIVVGNVMSRGNPAIEYMLNRGLSYTSGPQWLAENVLRDRWVLAVAGTHGKTTTSSMLAWILEYAGLKPGFLIGGVPANFGVSARLGESPFFVVEADEYDTAFFDKRSKFVHYHPRTVILNNLEFDHADIFENLDAIKKQFHHLVRIVPGEGLLVVNGEDKNLAEVLRKGCWTPTETFGEDQTSSWRSDQVSADGRNFTISINGINYGAVHNTLLGRHNRLNALAAIAAARHAGVPVAQSIEALTHFKGVKRRMELRGEFNGIRVYDDFAHHPTAIIETLSGLRAAAGSARIWAVLEPRSNTMRMGAHKQQLAPSLLQADQVLMYQPEEIDWDMQSVVDELGVKGRLLRTIDDIVLLLSKEVRPGDHVLVMSNGAFGGVHQKIVDALK
ncbi:MAG: UDP-N-acetylmuramate:L-alanyl-gamma-D-glutamyl-meso-diaminopimelate ligase [Gammaproteobacteria bacterium]|nr:UDP-N-acetylmuramate:L-alanyl-gamma-D-glutamyl-meso-diaminopimelate ligase [Gammaproteobacteria bacterium]